VGRSYPIPVLTSPKQHWASDAADEHQLFYSMKIATNGNFLRALILQRVIYAHDTFLIISTLLFCRK